MHSTPVEVSAIHCRNSEMRARSSHRPSPSSGVCLAMVSMKAVSSAISTTRITTGPEQSSGRKKSSWDAGAGAAMEKVSALPRRSAIPAELLFEQGVLEAEQRRDVFTLVAVFHQPPIVHPSHLHHRQLHTPGRGHLLHDVEILVVQRDLEAQGKLLAHHVGTAVGQEPGARGAATHHFDDFLEWQTLGFRE